MTENETSSATRPEQPRGWTLVSSWVAMVAIGLSSFAIIFLIPRFEAVFAEMAAGVALPTMTVLLIGLSRFVSNWFLLLVFPMIGLVVYLLVGRPIALIRFLSVFIIIIAVLFFIVVLLALLLPMQQLIQEMQ